MLCTSKTFLQLSHAKLSELVESVSLHRPHTIHAPVRHMPQIRHHLLPRMRLSLCLSLMSLLNLLLLSMGPIGRHSRCLLPSSRNSLLRNRRADVPLLQKVQDIVEVLILHLLDYSCSSHAWDETLLRRRLLRMWLGVRGMLHCGGAVDIDLLAIHLLVVVAK